AVTGDVEHHAAGEDTVLPVLDGAEPGAVEADLLLGIAAVPHRLLVPRVAKRVNVGGGNAVIEDAVVVGGEAAFAARVRLHVMVRGQRVVRTGLLGERAAERDAAAAFHQAGGGGALGRRDQVHHALLIILAPAAPVATLADPAHHFLVGR